jgi:hypothetical protein
MHTTIVLVHQGKGFFHIFCKPVWRCMILYVDLFGNPVLHFSSILDVVYIVNGWPACCGTLKRDNKYIKVC